MLTARYGLDLYIRQFNIQQFYVLPSQCIYVFCVDLRTNSDYLWSERENQQDATVRCLFLIISQHVSGIIGHTDARNMLRHC